MTDGNSGAPTAHDSAAIKKFLNEWGFRIQEPTPDEEAEVIASRLGLKEKRVIDPSHQEAP